MAKYLPATLEVGKPREGDPRTVKVRIWTDAAVRAQPRWKDEINEQIDYANQTLQPLLGARLAVDKWNEWDREGDPHTALQALAKADNGDGVTWVIGYMAPPDAASKAMGDLAFAEPLGHYVVVRNWNDKAEAEALSGTLPDLKDTERVEITQAHHRHKQTVLLLHALATTLGAIAESDPNWLQNPAYSRKQVSFSDRNRELMTLALDGKLAEDKDQDIAKKLLESIEKSEWGGWVQTDKDEVSKRMRNILDAAKAGQTATDVPPAAYDQFSRIKTLAQQGKIPDALAELDNLLTAYPGNASMHQLKCQILIAKPGVADKATRTACDRAIALAPGDPAVHLMIGEALLRGGDVKAARAELSVAEGKIDNLPKDKEDAWRKLIAQYQQMGALTWTEEAIARAKLENDPVAVQIAQVRARYGVPKGSKQVPPEQEAAFVAAMRGALDLIYSAKYGEAEKALAAAEKKWPGAAGLYSTRCNLSLQLGQIGPAKAACAKALSIDPKASWALYLGGIISLRDASGTKAGIESLKKAIEADPELAQAWRALAKAYKSRTNDKAALEQLSKDYQAKFGQPLAP